MKLFRKLVILSHRYLGIVFSLLVIMWFASGITMMYVGGMPRVEPQTRLDRLPPVDFAQVKLSPSDAAEKAQVRGAARPVLLTVMDRPAYRFGGREATTVFADTGDVMDEISADQSRGVAAHFAGVPVDKVRFLATIEEQDQWTLGQRRQMPLHKFAVADGEGTEIYVQPATADIAMLTTSRTRAYAWISTIPHWLYFTGLKTRQPIWYKTVVYTSEFACVVAFLGLILGFTQARWGAFNIRRPFNLSKAIPYSGWMRWHYITGVVFGVFTLTWAFSGLLSMEPWEWTNAEGLAVPRNVFTGRPLDLKQFPAPDPAVWANVAEAGTIKEIEYSRIQDENYYVIRRGAQTAGTALDAKRERLHQPYNITGRGSENRLLVSANTMQVRRDPFTTESLIARLKRAVPKVPIVEQTMLTEYDDYYYSRGRQTPLPVLRVKFADPMETWFYVDPSNSQMLTSVHKYSRVERWLYNGLHSLDFAFWYNKRPLWDLGMIVLLLGGLASSTLGLVMGIKRMFRAGSRAVRPRPSAVESETRVPVAGD